MSFEGKIRLDYTIQKETYKQQRKKLEACFYYVTPVAYAFYSVTTTHANQIVHPRMNLADQLQGTMVPKTRTDY